MPCHAMPKTEVKISFSVLLILKSDIIACPNILNDTVYRIVDH